MEDHYGTSDRAVALYADVLGQHGLTEYRRLAVESWDKLPALSAQHRARDELPGGYDRLKDILDFFAEREGDVDARIALRAKDLSSPENYLRLAEFCLSQGRKEEALRRAEEGLWVFEDDRPDGGLVLFTVDLLSKAGRKKDAEARIWRPFEQQPSFDLYTRLRKLGGEAARGRVVELLEAKLSERRPGLLTAEFLIRILVHEKMFDAAWAIARKHEVWLGWRDTLAQASEATHRARRSRSTPSASTGSPTPAAIPLTSKRQSSSPAWPLCGAPPSRRPMWRHSSRASAANILS